MECCYHAFALIPIDCGGSADDVVGAIADYLVSHGCRRDVVLLAEHLDGSGWELVDHSFDLDHPVHNADRLMNKKSCNRRKEEKL